MNRTMLTDEAIKRWDKHAEFFTANYTELGDKARIVYLNPTILPLMEDVKGKNVLDAGCGEGYLSRMLAERGANVTAVDYSKKMLEIAKTRTDNNTNITYHYGNCEDLHFLKDNQFDLIISNMVIQDLQDYQAAIQEMFRLLKEGGQFIFSILHTCFITPNSGWVRNEDGEKLFWKVEKYFYEGAYEQNFPADADDKVVYYHRTLSSYVKAIRKAGFTLMDMEEPKPTEDVLKKYPELKEDFNCADFIIFICEK
ncbi:class I SAM-dependent methyltransferase [Ornithinibacillus halotolerans]|uniref:Class I SAM-dependent methyltransferase n=1 Tax=Ornithinibacillus halotolerans TaxID=1274357 RepID=A0A916W788_9BACI|nr:class I SAM-dependent methyltransferase [Ornithinibacillus halotolerans]GGA72469.1 class I SAM-dependent methyltransferase [Ornithinibacillus halotolerans]